MNYRRKMFFNRKEQLKKDIKEKEIYSRLFNNQDFKKWKEEVIDKRLEVLKSNVLQIDRQNPYWREVACDFIIQYQETEFAFKRYFESMKAIEDYNKNQLKNLK